ncbi:SCAM1-like protein [Mya arenaria]|uniref:Secretory carrier-associated membrane protein n=1 Tax=Mya arenaria TaxID=6604 RepID=A0ABY7DSC2_MYAAR|nr:SCAM1-like protein [Mya arenaria]
MTIDPPAEIDFEQLEAKSPRKGWTHQCSKLEVVARDKLAGQPTIPPPQSSPAIMQPSSDAPPPYTQSSAQRIDTSELERRQQELEKKAEELARKEQEMKNMQFQDRQNNWPPLPGWFPVGPCFYQDFSVDIPLEFQRTVKIIYYIWMFYAFTLFLNFMGSMAYFIVDSNGGPTFGLSILWFILFTPCSFICWYRPVYKAFRSDSSFNFFVFFFIFFFQFCVCVLMCLGITDFSVGIIGGLRVVGQNVVVGLIMILVGIFFGALATLMLVLLCKVTVEIGWINGLRTIGKHLGAGIFMLIVAFFLSVISGVKMFIGWINSLKTIGGNLAAGLVMLVVSLFFTITAVVSIVMLIKVHRIYRSTGASFAKAQQEFATGVMKNEAVQQGVSNAASSAAQGAVRGAASQYGTGGKY